MDKKDIDYIKEMIKKEQKLLEIRLHEKMKKDMIQFESHLYYEINKKLMRLGLFHRNIDFLAIKHSFEHLVNAIRLRLKFNLKI